MKLNELEDILQGVSLTSEVSKRSLDAILSYGELLNTYIIAQAAIQRGIKQTLSTQERSSKQIVISVRQK